MLKKACKPPPTLKPRHRDQRSERHHKFQESQQEMVDISLISAAAFGRDEEDNLLFPPLSAHDVIHRPVSEGGGKARTARRRRKKASGWDGSDGKKRRLSDEQVKLLEKRFGEEKKLEVGRKVQLAAELGLDPKQVAVWFQNRRARHKSKQVEEAYLKLKAAHEVTILEKCHLENEVLKLKDRLLAAQEEIKKFSPGATGATSGSEFIGSPSSSSLTYQPLGAHHQGALEEKGELMCMQEYDFSDYYMMEYLACFYGV